MKLVLQNPNWRKENLPRIRDVIDQQLSELRRRMQGSEESWVNNPSDAYRNQDNPLYLTTTSFLTQAHNVQRLRWMLKGGQDSANTIAIDGLSYRAIRGPGTRATELKTLLAVLGGDAAQAGKVIPPT